MRVSDDLKVFEKRFTFVQTVSLSNDGVVFQLNPRHDSAPAAIDLTLWDFDGRVVATYSDSNLRASAKPWKLPAVLSPGLYKAVIRLDGELGFHAFLKLDNASF